MILKERKFSPFSFVAEKWIYSFFCYHILPSSSLPLSLFFLSRTFLPSCFLFSLGRLRYLFMLCLFSTNQGEKIYLHCWGGHGRTGTVAAVLLGLLYDISPREALNRVQKYHDVRLEASQYRMKIDSPQRPSQRQQVRRVLLGWVTPVTVNGFRGYHRKNENCPANGQNLISNTPDPKDNNYKNEHTTPSESTPLHAASAGTKIAPKKFDFASINGSGSPQGKLPSSPMRARTPAANDKYSSGVREQWSNSAVAQGNNANNTRILPSPMNLKVSPMKPLIQGNLPPTPTNVAKKPTSPGSISLPPGYVTPFSGPSQSKSPKSSNLNNRSPYARTPQHKPFSPQHKSPGSPSSPSNRFRSSRHMQPHTRGW